VAKANGTLALRGLVTREVTYAPSAEPRGTVISQQPISGTLVPSGTRASLTLSDGSLAVKSEYDFEYENENTDTSERGDESCAR
jgi:beta-lactam-binding protein with PASTA domain